MPPKKSKAKKEKAAEKVEEPVKEVVEEEEEKMEEEEEKPQEEEMNGDQSEEAQTEEEEGEKSEDEPKKKKKKRYHAIDAQHPPATEMILEALAENTSSKGMTIVAIREFITREYTVRPWLLKNMLRNAFTKLLAKEFIMRPKGIEAKTVLMGRWKMAPKKAEAEAEKKAPVRPLRSNNLGKVVKKKSKKRRGW